MNRRCVIGIDIGGTNFRIGAVCPECGLKAQHFRKVRVGEVFCSRDPLNDLTQYLRRYCEMLSRESIEPEAVVIGFPATLDRERRTVLQAPNIAFMENLPVVEKLACSLSLPVLIERDVCLSLLYDRNKYGLPPCEVLCGIYFGTGIGNAIMIDGRLLAGKDGAAGELGHIPVDGSSEVCGCGNVGCMENLAGGKYLARLASDVYPQTAVEHLFASHPDSAMLHQFVDRMAMTVAAEVNILNPDYVLIGGGVPQMEAFPREELREKICIHTRAPYPRQALALIFTEDEQDKAVVGAALLAQQRLGDRKVPD